MRRTLAVLLVPLVAVSPSLADPGVTTAHVNFRAGPGTGNQSFGVVPSGTPLDILDCTGTSDWCFVAIDGVGGYVSARYVAETASEQMAALALPSTKRSPCRGDDGSGKRDA